MPAAAAPLVLMLSAAHPPTDLRIVAKEGAALAEAGWRVTHLAPAPQRGAKDVPSSLAGVTLVTYPRPSGWLGRLRAARALAARAAKLKPDVIHAHEPDSWYAAILAATRTGAAVVLDVHEHYPSRLDTRLPPLFRGLGRRAVRAACRWMAARADAVVVAKDGLEDAFPGVRIVPVRNYAAGVPVRPRDHRHGPVTLVHLGALTRERGAFEMLQALPQCPEGTRLSLVGRFTDGSETEFLAEARRLGLADVVERHGWMPHEAALAMAAEADIGLVLFQPGHENHRLALPHKLFDCMLAGIPVIVPDFAEEVAAVVRETGCGVLVDTADPATIAEAVHALADPQLRAEMGAAGRAAALGRYGWAGEAERLVDLYRSLAPLPDARLQAMPREPVPVPEAPLLNVSATRAPVSEAPAPKAPAPKVPVPEGSVPPAFPARFAPRVGEPAPRAAPPRGPVRDRSPAMRGAVPPATIPPPEITARPAAIVPLPARMPHAPAPIPAVPASKTPWAGEAARPLNPDDAFASLSAAMRAAAPPPLRQAPATDPIIDPADGPGGAFASLSAAMRAASPLPRPASSPVLMPVSMPVPAAPTARLPGREAGRTLDTAGAFASLSSALRGAAAQPPTPSPVSSSVPRLLLDAALSDAEAMPEAFAAMLARKAPERPPGPPLPADLPPPSQVLGPMPAEDPAPTSPSAPPSPPQAGRPPAGSLRGYLSESLTEPRSESRAEPASGAPGQPAADVRSPSAALGSVVRALRAAPPPLTPPSLAQPPVAQPSLAPPPPAVPEPTSSRPTIPERALPHPAATPTQAAAVWPFPLLAAVGDAIKAPPLPPTPPRPAPPPRQNPVLPAMTGRSIEVAPEAAGERLLLEAGLSGAAVPPSVAAVLAHPVRSPVPEPLRAPLTSDVPLIQAGLRVAGPAAEAPAETPEWRLLRAAASGPGPARPPAPPPGSSPSPSLSPIPAPPSP